MTLLNFVKKIVSKDSLEYQSVKAWLEVIQKNIGNGKKMDELLDLVDKNDCVIGQMLRSEVYAKNLSNFRAVNAFLINDENKLWIPRRSANKRIFPLSLDTSVGGHVQAGETYEQGFTRELQEEVGIDASVTPYEYIGSLNPHDHGTAAFMRVYLLRVKEAPSYNREDFIEYFWLTPEEVLERIALGEPSKSDLPIILKHLFL